MIKYLSKEVVALNINGHKKSYINSKKNRELLINEVPIEVWEEIMKVWEGNELNVEEKPLSSKNKKIMQEKCIEKMKQNCVEVISNGIDFNNEHYSFEITDQLNLSRLMNQCNNGKEKVIYHADGQLCRFYSKEEILRLYEAMENFIEYHTTYFNSLKNYIQSLEYETEIESIYYGINIPNSILTTLINKEE